MAKIGAASLARLLLAWCVVCVGVSSAHSANTHGRPDMMGEMQAWFGDGFTPYVASGCLPAVPSSSLTFASFACTGYVRGALADLVYVTQPALGLTLANTNGLHWLALHRDTASAVAGWTRRAGSHYLFQQAATQPASPVGGLVIAQATVAGGVITAVQAVAQARSPVSAALTLINVMDYGATADGVTDDTAAILTAIAAIPGTDSTGSFYNTKGAGCLYFPLPKTVGGFYKVSSTLNFTEKWNGCMIAPAKYGRDRTGGTEQMALIKWYGATNQNVIVLHNVQNMRLTNISVNCRGIAGTRGIALGADATAVSSVKLIEGSGLEVENCDVGIRFGDFAANGPDIAGNTFNDVYVHNNVSQGVAQHSGNGLLYMRNLTAESNGSAPTGGKTGCNVYGEGGTIHLLDYVGLGTGGNKPAIGDVCGDSVGIMLDNAWSETDTPMAVSNGPSNLASYIHGGRHYAGGMTDTTTPNSVIWSSNNPLVIDGFFFGNIQVNAGNSSLVMDSGVRFYAGAQHTLSLVPTFTGTAVVNQLAYVGMPTGASHGRMAIGRPPRTDLGGLLYADPGLEITGREQQTLVAYCTVDATDATINGCNTMAMQRGGTLGVGAWHFLGNAYFDNTTAQIKAIKPGRVSLFLVQGGNPAAGQPAIVVKYDNATLAGDVVFSPGITLFSTGLPATGVSTTPVVTIGPNHLGWATAPPTSGPWVVGDIFFNSASASGQPSGWMCTIAGMPGTWKALANIP